MKKVWKQSLILLMILVTVMGISLGINTIEDNAASTMQVTAIDVGQGSAFLIKNGSTATLVDTGEEYKYSTVLSALKKAGVKTITNLVITHPDSDHIGAADLLIKNKSLKIKKIYTTNFKNKTTDYKEFVSAAKKASLKIKYVKAGQKLNIGSGATCTVLSPENKKYSSANESSVVMMVKHGNIKFLMTGDATAKIENTINSKYNIKCNVLFVAHHGSDSASGIKFVKDTHADYSVISVGKNNYGHPDSNVLRRLQKYTKKTLRTDKNGTITFTSTGKKLTVKTSKSSSSNNTTATTSTQTTTQTSSKTNIIGNVNSKVYHTRDCKHLPIEKNRKYFSSESAAKKAGYHLCSFCAK